MEHTALVIRPPDLSRLENSEFKAFRNKVHAERKKARKEATKLIYKEPKLREAWLGSLGSDPVKSIESRQMFEQELVHHPSAFLKHTWANALAALDDSLMTEMLDRAKPVKRVKRT